jgi:23S rRNA pseudouridine2605 synthase
MASKDGSEFRPIKTLERMFSKAGVGSRTEAREWIREGRVRVNGKLVTDPDQWVDLQRDRITFDGKFLRAQKPLYLLLYKPKGYLTTYKDPQGRPTVFDLIPDIDQWVFPVGRLDKDTTGLLLLTNDTEFAERITNPSFKVAKTYLVKASCRLSDEALEKLRQGVVLSDGPTRPAQVTRLRDSGNRTFFEITITEGRNRQVRRMVEALDSTVLKLVRTAIGPLHIGDLQIGSYRLLSPEEVRLLAGVSSSTTRNTSKHKQKQNAPRGTAPPAPTKSNRRPRRGPGR